MKKIYFTMALLCATLSFAQTLPPAEQEEARRIGEQIQWGEQRIFEEELRKRELENALRPPTDLQPKTTMPELAAEGNCVQANIIEYSGNTEISSNKIDKVIADFTERCLTLDEINAILQLITNIYIDSGYITSRAYLTMPQERLSEGVLEIKIIEGKVSEVEGLRKSEVFMAFPKTKDRILYLRDIEQGLDQLNRLPSNKATMDITPDEEKENVSKIEITNSPKGNTRLSAAFDNAGSVSTGEWRGGLKFAHDNLFRLNDQINISYYKAIYDNYGQRDSDSVLVSFSVPFGYWTVTNNFSYSSNRSNTPLPVSRTSLYTIGESTSNTFSVGRLMARGQKYKISLGAGLVYKHSNSYTEVFDFTTKNEGASRTLTVLNIEAPLTLYFNSGMAYIKPSYHRGIHLFGSLDDSDTAYTQKAQYEAYKLYAYYMRRLWLGTLNITVDGQYSADELYSSESFYIGGEYSVRGFKNDGGQGESGLAVRTEYSLNMGQLSSKSFLLPYTVSVFFDYGCTKPNNESYRDYHLAGAGGKLAIYYKYFEASLTYASVLHKTNDISDNNALYFSTEFKYAF